MVRGYFLTLSRALAGQPSRSSQDRRLESSQPVGLRTEKQETGLEGFQVIIIVSALQSPVYTALTRPISLMSSKLGLTEDVEQDG